MTIVLTRTVIRNTKWEIYSKGKRVAWGYGFNDRRALQNARKRRNWMALPEPLYPQKWIKP